MALNKEYFEGIHIDVVKKKYYNANKVEAVFADIRRQAEELNAENQRLRSRLEGLSGQKEALGDTILFAQEIYQEIIERANQEADQILAEARQESEQMRKDASRQQEQAAYQMERCLSKVRQLQQDAIDTINAEWQAFLCGLYPEVKMPARREEEPPADLARKVDAIAREMKAIGSEK